MSRLLKYLSATPTSNTGSVARDHLANERTFLSWTRTGLGFVALGVALAKLSALEALSPALAHDHGDLKVPSAALVGRYVISPSSSFLVGRFRTVRTFLLFFFVWEVLGHQNRNRNSRSVWIFLD
jgi:uncharacterized membrane protein YidH (DUF202 family)